MSLVNAPIINELRPEGRVPYTCLFSTYGLYCCCCNQVSIIKSNHITSHHYFNNKKPHNTHTETERQIDIYIKEINKNNEFSYTHLVFQR